MYELYKKIEDMLTTKDYRVQWGLFLSMVVLGVGFGWVVFTNPPFTTRPTIGDMKTQQ